MEAMEVENGNESSSTIIDYDEKIEEMLKEYVAQETEDEIPQELNEIIVNIAKSGSIPYDWSDILVLFRRKTSQALKAMFTRKGFIGPVTQSFDSRLSELFSLYDDHISFPPFTTQRIAEVLTRGDKEYKTTHAMMNGLAKLLSVQPSSGDDDPTFIYPPISSETYYGVHYL